MHSTRLSRRQFSAGMGAALLTGASLARAQSETRIVLGQSAALTGPASQLGLQFQAGVGSMCGDFGEGWTGGNGLR